MIMIKVKKEFLLVVSGTIMLLVLFGIGLRYLKGNNDLNLNKNKVSQINISSVGGNEGPSLLMETINKNQISTIIDYLNTLNLVKTNKMEEKRYLGGGYTIDILYKNDTKREITHFGNLFLIDSEGLTYEIDIEEALKFHPIKASIRESIQSEKGDPWLEGVVSSGYSNYACKIRDNDGVVHNVYIQDAYIEDYTGGDLILRDGDEVRVFYKEDTYINEDYLIATAVFITKKVELEWD
ncbi:UNVERIFIED_CONTAM: hypothetical protein Cloal_0109 [Acetivibrio alkalicellulosi]